MSAEWFYWEQTTSFRVFTIIIRHILVGGRGDQWLEGTAHHGNAVVYHLSSKWWQFSSWLLQIRDFDAILENHTPLEPDRRVSLRIPASSYRCCLESWQLWTRYLRLLSIASSSLSRCFFCYQCLSVVVVAGGWTNDRSRSWWKWSSGRIGRWWFLENVLSRRDMLHRGIQL